MHFTILVYTLLDVELKDDLGFTALHLASMYGHDDCVELLLQGVQVLASLCLFTMTI